MTTVQLLIGALTLLTNAFFVGAEFALISVRRSQIEPAALKGNRRAKTTLWGLRAPLRRHGHRPARHHHLLPGARRGRRTGHRPPAGAPVRSHRCTRGR